MTPSVFTWTPSYPSSHTTSFSGSLHPRRFRGREEKTLRQGWFAQNHKAKEYFLRMIELQGFAYDVYSFARENPRSQASDGLWFCAKYRGHKHQRETKLIDYNHDF